MATGMLSQLHLIDDSTVSKLLKWEELIPAVEKALQNFSKGPSGDVHQPVRTTVELKKNNGMLLAMPSYAGYEDALAAKLISVFEDNGEKGLPSHSGVVVLFDATTGIPKAIIDAVILTAMRTAAASVVATKYLVPHEPRILAVLGAGVQGKSHCQAMSYQFQFSQIRVWNRNFEKAAKLVAEMSSSKQIIVCKTVKEAVENADVIVTATHSSTPILKAEWVKTGAVVNVVGACHVTYQEVDSDLMNNSVVYVDSIEAALKESGDIVINKVQIAGEIGEIIDGKKKVPKHKFIVCKLLGLAVEDAVTAKIIHNNYLKTV